MTENSEVPPAGPERDAAEQSSRRAAAGGQDHRDPQGAGQQPGRGQKEHGEVNVAPQGEQGDGAIRPAVRLTGTQTKQFMIKRNVQSSR